MRAHLMGECPIKSFRASPHIQGNQNKIGQKNQYPENQAYELQGNKARIKISKQSPCH